MDAPHFSFLTDPLIIKSNKIYNFLSKSTETNKRTPTMDDEKIIELFWQRDERAIKETADKYGGFCFAIAFNILESKEDAEECVNDVWHRVWASIPPQRPEHFRAFLGRIVRNKAINRWHELRAKKRSAGLEALFDELEEVLPSGHTVDRELESREISEEISAWLKGLERSDRSLFIRRYWYGMPLKDLAAETDIRPARLAQRMHRLRLSLKKHLEERGITL